MTQTGETNGLALRDHIRAIEAQLASLGFEPRLFNAVLSQDVLPTSDLGRHYQRRRADLVRCDAEVLRSDGYAGTLPMSKNGMAATAGGTIPSATVNPATSLGWFPMVITRSCWESGVTCFGGSATLCD